MKTNIVRIFIAFACLFTSITISAQCDAKKLTGNWSYSTSDAPAEYQNGTIKFTEKEGMLTAVVTCTDGTFAINKITRSEDKKSFKCSILLGGTNVDLTLTPKEEDTFEGTAFAEYQTFPIRFKRIKETKTTE